VPTCLTTRDAAPVLSNSQDCGRIRSTVLWTVWSRVASACQLLEGNWRHSGCCVDLKCATCCILSDFWCPLRLRHFVSSKRRRPVYYPVTRHIPLLPEGSIRCDACLPACQPKERETSTILVSRETWQQPLVCPELKLVDPESRQNGFLPVVTRSWLKNRYS
jgi:hypothetical protein